MPDEKSSAWSDYFGYFGTYRIDLPQKAVIHHIEGSWFPNLVGTEQVRYFQFEGKHLILDANTEWGRVHVRRESAVSDARAPRYRAREGQPDLQ